MLEAQTNESAPLVLMMFTHTMTTKHSETAHCNTPHATQYQEYNPLSTVPVWRGVAYLHLLCSPALKTNASTTVCGLAQLD
jgi:hypothetical protein